MLRGAALLAAAVFVLAGLTACESTPERVFTYGARGAEIQAERMVAYVYGRPADPLPYGSPEVDAAVAGIKSRWPLLRPLLDDGTLGLTEDGDIALRDAGLRERAELRRLRALVRAENRDRYFLYRGMTIAVGHGDDSLPLAIDRTEDAFARQWLQQAPAGWWIQDHRGQWSRKP